MVKRSPKSLQENLLVVTERSEANLSTEIPPSGVRSSFEDWASVSKQLEQLAVRLRSVVDIVNSDPTDIRKNILRISAVRKLIRLAGDVACRINQFDELFSSVGLLRDVVRVSTRSYHSAHYAAFAEARELIVGIQHFNIHRQLAGKLRKKGVDPGAEFLGDIIFARSENWCKDFNDVIARVRRERVALERALATRDSSAPAHQDPNSGERGSTEQNRTTGPPYGKASRPTPETLGVIRLLERGKSYDEITASTGKSIQAVRKISSRLKKNEYTL